MMMQSDYITRLRESRDATSVLKMRLINLRGRIPGRPILVFEGDDDKVVYGRWIPRIRSNFYYAAFVCKGKRGVASVQKICDEDLGSLHKDVYLFIDRDYDDDVQFRSSQQLFMTDRYSVENYLVSGEVVNSIARDEFPCHEYPDLVQSIVAQFERDYSDFLRETFEINRRLFKYRRLKIDPPKSIPTKVAHFASVAIGAIGISSLDIEDTLPSIHAIPRRLDEDLCSEFDGLNPQLRYRGKNSFLFLLKWLELLAADFDGKSGIFDGLRIAGKVRKKEFTLGAFASKSSMPLGLASFINRMAA